MEINEQLLIEIGQVVDKLAGDNIFRAGDPGEEMYVILEGIVEIYLEEQGTRIPVATLSKGDFFGEMAILEQMPRSGTAVAVQKSKLVLLQQQSFRQLMTEDSVLAWRVMKGFSSRIRNVNHELAHRIGHDLQEVSKLLQHNAVLISDNIKQIAASAQEIDMNERHLAQQMKEVQTIYKEIDGMLDFIQNVASQTHILGLNAAIEAARSGEQGRGFGVIAEEIRKLSALSKHNAEQIAKLTAEIRDKMNAVTIASQDSAQKSNVQADATRKMVSFVDEVTGLAERLTHIASSLV